MSRGLPVSKHLLFTAALLWTQLSLGSSADWTYRDAIKSGKTAVSIATEQSIDRGRVRISQNIEQRAPKIRSERVEFDSALRDKRIEKTNELITQLESLRKRPQQARRQGEILMRLGELYFDRSTDVAIGESENWEREIRRWEKKEASKRGSRPVLKTPKADQLRRRSLSLYRELEQKSRNPRAKVAEMIRRDEVLFYLGITYMDLREPLKGIPHLAELISKYPKSPRIFGARLQLADALFDQRAYKSALEHYLQLVASGARSKHMSDPMRAYTFYKMGWCYINLGSYDKAILSFKKTVDFSKDTPQAIGYKSEALMDLTRAFALAGLYEEGEKYLKSADGDRDELLSSFYSQVIDLAESRGDLNRARWGLQKLTALDIGPSLKRTLALRELGLLQKSGKTQDFWKALKEFAENYGRGSSAFRKVDESEQKLFEEELVTLLRSEAKAAHSRAQRNKRRPSYEAARPFYELYFEYVPKPNQDSETNRWEMHFYFAELLYALNDYSAAEKAYTEVAGGKHQNAAQYARLLTLRELAKKDDSRLSDFETAIDAFRKSFPNDSRGADLLYEMAYLAYEKKDLKLAEKRLLAVLAEYPENARAKDAVERLLFVWEQDGDFEKASEKAKELLADPRFAKLVKGSSDRRRLEDFSDRAQFKDIEKLPHNSESEKRAKASAYFKLAGELKGNLREKALNNALAYADQSEDTELRLLIQQRFLQEFPNSPYIADIYLKGGELYALQGRFEAAQGSYQKYLDIELKKKSGRDIAAIEKARWNLILILGHLENAWSPDAESPKALSRNLLVAATDFVSQHPRSRFRKNVFELLVFRKGIGTKELASYARVPALTNDEKRSLRFAEILVATRLKDSNQISAKLKAYPSSQSSAWSPFERKAVALAAFHNLERARSRFAAMKIEYTPQKFVPTLQKKFKALEDLERDSLTVVQYGDGDVALRCLTKISEDYERLAQDISRAEIPKEDLASFVDPLKEKSKSYIRNCFDKAKEFRISGRGLIQCQARSQTSKTATLWLSELPRPTPAFLPDSIDSGAPTLLASAWKSLKGRAYGQSGLALQVLKETDEKSGAQALAQTIEGILVWERGDDNAEALRLFRIALDDAPSKDRELVTALRRNLAAAYFQVADYERAIEFSRALGSSDALAIQIEGLSHLLTGDYKRAESFFSKASSNFKKNREILLYWAIAQGESGNTISAHRNLQDYLELTRPPRDHFARELFKLWGIKK